MGEQHTPWTAEWLEESSDWVVMGCVYAPDDDGIAWQPNICTLSDSVSGDVARLIASAPAMRRALEAIANPTYGLGFNKLRGIARKALSEIDSLRATGTKDPASDGGRDG